MENVPEAYGDWLSGYNWDIWATLTFARQPSPVGALDAWRTFFRKQVREYSSRAFAFAATEEGRIYGRVHMHALIGGMLPEKIVPPREWVDRTWRKFRGIAYVCDYDAEKKASYYIAKYVTKQLAEYEVSGLWTEKC